MFLKNISHERQGKLRTCHRLEYRNEEDRKLNIMWGPETTEKGIIRKTVNFE